MKQLEPLLDGTALTVTGQTVAENLAGVTVADPEVIRPPGTRSGQPADDRADPRQPRPDGGIVKLAVADDRRLDFAGPASLRVRRKRRSTACARALSSPAQVVVLRGLGVTGARHGHGLRSSCSRSTAPG